MKRSCINKEILWAKKLLNDYNIKLPEFGYWGIDKWIENIEKLNVIKEVMLGWDITDFGQNKFNEFGAVLFTLRNGSLKNNKIGTPYAEKLIILKDGQHLPLHYHKNKTEDIINRGGGILGIKLYNSLNNGDVDYKSDVVVERDGIRYIIKPGEEVIIKNGQSITLRPYMYHIFYAKKSFGDLICGEVSSVNDDLIDNYNAEDISRFSDIEEDVKILYPLCNEYEMLLKK